MSKYRVGRCLQPLGSVNAKNILGYIQEALSFSGGEQTLSDVLGNLATGRSFLVVVYDEDIACAAVVASVMTYARRKALRLVLGGGEDLKAWQVPLLAHLEELCRKLDADRIELIGRPGWARALKPLGFEQHCFMVREVPKDVDGL